MVEAPKPLVQKVEPNYTGGDKQQYELTVRTAMQQQGLNLSNSNPKVGDVAFNSIAALDERGNKTAYVQYIDPQGKIYLTTDQSQIGKAPSQQVQSFASGKEGLLETPDELQSKGQYGYVYVPTNKPITDYGEMYTRRTQAEQRTIEGDKQIREFAESKDYSNEQKIQVLIQSGYAKWVAQDLVNKYSPNKPIVVNSSQSLKQVMENKSNTASDTSSTVEEILSVPAMSKSYYTTRLVSELGYSPSEANKIVNEMNVPIKVELGKETVNYLQRLQDKVTEQNQNLPFFVQGQGIITPTSQIERKLQNVLFEKTIETNQELQAKIDDYITTAELAANGIYLSGTTKENINEILEQKRKAILEEKENAINTNAFYNYEQQKFSEQVFSSQSKGLELQSALMQNIPELKISPLRQVEITTKPEEPTIYPPSHLQQAISGELGFTEQFRANALVLSRTIQNPLPFLEKTYGGLSQNVSGLGRVILEDVMATTISGKPYIFPVGEKTFEAAIRHPEVTFFPVIVPLTAIGRVQKGFEVSATPYIGQQRAELLSNVALFGALGGTEGAIGIVSGAVGGAGFVLGEKVYGALPLPQTAPIPSNLFFSKEQIQQMGLPESIQIPIKPIAGLVTGIVGGIGTAKTLSKAISYNLKLDKDVTLLAKEQFPYIEQKGKIYGIDEIIKGRKTVGVIETKFLGKTIKTEPFYLTGVKSIVATKTINPKVLQAKTIFEMQATTISGKTFTSGSQFLEMPIKSVGRSSATKIPSTERVPLEELKRNYFSAIEKYADFKSKLPVGQKIKYPQTFVESRLIEKISTAKAEYDLAKSFIGKEIGDIKLLTEYRLSLQELNAAKATKVTPKEIEYLQRQTSFLKKQYLQSKADFVPTKSFYESKQFVTLPKGKIAVVMGQKIGGKIHYDKLDFFDVKESARIPDISFSKSNIGVSKKLDIIGKTTEKKAGLLNFGQVDYPFGKLIKGGELKIQADFGEIIKKSKGTLKSIIDIQNVGKKQLVVEKVKVERPPFVARNVNNKIMIVNEGRKAKLVPEIKIKRLAPSKESVSFTVERESGFQKVIEPKNRAFKELFGKLEGRLESTTNIIKTQKAKLLKPFSIVSESRKAELKAGAIPKNDFEKAIVEQKQKPTIIENKQPSSVALTKTEKAIVKQKENSVSFTKQQVEAVKSAGYAESFKSLESAVSQTRIEPKPVLSFGTSSIQQQKQGNLQNVEKIIMQQPKTISYGKERPIIKTSNLEATIYKTEGKQATEIKSNSLINLGLKTNSIFKEEIKQANKIKTESKTKQDEDTKQQQRYESKTGYKSMAMARTLTILKTKTKIIEPTRVKIFEPELPPPPTPDESKPINLPKDEESIFNKKKKRKSAFGVFVKRKGKLEKINKTPLTERAALALGGKITEETAARSFIILPEKTSIAAKELDIPSLNAEKYYKSKKGLMTEKTRFAINTPGELREITYRGLATKNNKGWWQK